MEMNIHVGDDDVRVKKSPKNEKPREKWKIRGHHEKGEKPPRGVGKRVRVRLTIPIIFG
jgi:hypothetical protein